MRLFSNRILKFVLVLTVVVGALGFALYRHENSSCTFRYKLTAEVMTPQGLKSGSSVVEVLYSSQWGPLVQGGRYDSLRGEAVYLDLGNDKNLFITLGTLDAAQTITHWNWPSRNSPLQEPADYANMKGPLDPLWLPIKIYMLGRTSGQEREMCRRVSKIKGAAPKIVLLNNLPTLVSFTDMSNPLTAKSVDPTDLASTFGAGYSMTVNTEITEAEITDQISKLLPWITSQAIGKSDRPSNRLALFELYKLGKLTEQTYLRN
jgi:hypothetical protein